MLKLPKLLIVDQDKTNTEIAPYQCAHCELNFKRLNGYIQHTKFLKLKGRCQTADDLKKAGLQEITHKANGNTYQVWEVMPGVQTDGKSENLKEAEDKADYKKRVNTSISESIRNNRTFDQMAIDSDNYNLYFENEIEALIQKMSKKRKSSQAKKELKQPEDDKFTPKYKTKEISTSKPFWMAENQDQFTEYDKAWKLLNTTTPNPRKAKK